MFRLVARAVGSPLKDWIIEATYPSTCAMCGKRGRWVCDLCIQDFTPLVPDLCCDRCGHPVIQNRCECRHMHPAIVKARASSVYDGWIAKSIHAFKYDREQGRAEHLAASMASAFVDLGPVDAIIPVPLHPNRRNWRGFNQAEMLANHLGAAFGIPVESALVRIRETETQTHSSREDRMENMDGAFALNPEWSLRRRRHYVLLDDVYTSGATVGACAEVLDAAGATTISVVTLAFDLRKRDLDLYRELVRSAKPQ